MDLESLIATCEDRLEQDADLLARAREQLHELDQVITQLEYAQQTVGTDEPERLRASLDHAREQRQQTTSLVVTLEARHAETQARYDRLKQQLKTDAASPPDESREPER